MNLPKRIHKTIWEIKLERDEAHKWPGLASDRIPLFDPSARCVIRCGDLALAAILLQADPYELSGYNMEFPHWRLFGVALIEDSAIARAATNITVDDVVARSVPLLGIVERAEGA